MLALRTSTASLRLLRSAGAAPRFISSSARLRKENDTGFNPNQPEMARPGDAFTRRGQANEKEYIAREEKEKLHALLKKIQDHKIHLNELEDAIHTTIGSKKDTSK